MKKENLFKYINKQIKEYQVHGMNFGQPVVALCDKCELPDSACECGREKQSDKHHIAKVSGMKLLENFSKVHFNSHKNHNSECDILEGHLDNDTMITYIINVNGPDKGKEEMEYYTGSNYVAGSNKKSFSRHFSSDQIPNQFKADWLKLKELYNSKYKRLNEEKIIVLWGKLSTEKKEELLSQIFKDTHNIEKYLDSDWNMLPDIAKANLRNSLESLKERKSSQRICKDCSFLKNECKCEEAKKITEEIIKSLKEEYNKSDIEFAISGLKMNMSPNRITKELKNNFDLNDREAFEVISKAMKMYKSKEQTNEVAPPHREAQVRALKKKFPAGSASPYKISWNSYNKSKKK